MFILNCIQHPSGNIRHAIIRAAEYLVSDVTDHLGWDGFVIREADIEEDREKAQMMGYTVVDAVTVLVTHLSEVLQRYSQELLTRQDVHGLLQEIAKENPKVVEELVPNPLPLSVVLRVLQGLPEERVS